MVPKPSASQGRGLASCPRCPDNLDSEGVGTVGHESSERATEAYLEAFLCPLGHTLNDLSLAQEATVLESAQEWIGRQLDAMESGYWDDRHDRLRDEGF